MKPNLYNICPKIGQQPTAEIACNYLTNIQDLHMVGDIMGCISRIVKRSNRASKYVQIKHQKKSDTGRVRKGDDPTP